MAKQKPSPEKRKTKLSEFFTSQPDQAFQVKELKNLLAHKDEPTLRRDLDDLVKNGTLSKSKDTSIYPNRAYYQYRNSSKKKNSSPAESVSPAKKAETPPAVKPSKAKPPKAAKPANKKAVKTSKPAEPTPTVFDVPDSKTADASTQTKAPSQASASSPAPDKALGKRAAARDLEARIIELVSAQPATVSEITSTLARQRPTIVKALERLTENATLSRTSDKRPFFYSLASAKSEITPQKTPATISNAPLKARSTQNSALLDQSPSMAQVTVNTLLDRLLASERRLWELEQKQ